MKLREGIAEISDPATILGREPGINERTRKLISRRRGADRGRSALLARLYRENHPTEGGVLVVQGRAAICRARVAIMMQDASPPVGIDGCEVCRGTGDVGPVQMVRVAGRRRASLGCPGRIACLAGLIDSRDHTDEDGIAQGVAAPAQGVPRRGCIRVRRVAEIALAIEATGLIGPRAFMKPPS